MAEEKKKINAYHVSKSSEDGLWRIKIAGSDKTIQTFKTKAEAEARVKTLEANTGRTALVHASKGKAKGKIQ